MKTPIIGVAVDRVASSWVDMLAGLSPWGILSMPPDFRANAGAGADTAISNCPDRGECVRVSFHRPLPALLPPPSLLYSQFVIGEPAEP